jgi:hypothetical protein
MFVESLIMKKDLRSELRNLIRQFRAISLPTTQIQNSVDNPKIEILCVAAGKDLNLLPLVLTQAVETSANEVTKITIITRSIDIARCKEVLEKIDFQTACEVLDEDLQFSSTLRMEIKENFGARYGWVLQQFLAVDYILKSNSPGVLLVNADTILLREMLWMNKKKEQVLMASTEFHPPYYQLLAKLIGIPKRSFHTHITHHMLFQPSVFREIFDCWKIGTIHDLAYWIFKNSEKNNQSPLCIEFELYAQGMTIIHPELVKLRKFANTTWKRNQESLNEVHKIIQIGASPKWNSISLHDYA